MLYENILRSFYENNLEYTIIGGIAVNLHGYNRLTGDLDIILSLSDSNIKKFVHIVKNLGLIPRLPVRIEDFSDEKHRHMWIAEKNMKVFSVYNPKNPLEHIDVKIDEEEHIDYFIKNSLTLEAGDIKIFVVSIDDLIRLKKEAGRERDFVDIRALEKIKEINS